MFNKTLFYFIEYFFIFKFQSIKMLIKIFPILLFISIIAGMLPEEKSQLRLQVIEMFKHGFGSYMVKNSKNI